jgi:two-component system, LuxR family, response regulator FixJ
MGGYAGPPFSGKRNVPSNGPCRAVHILAAEGAMCIRHALQSPEFHLLAHASPTAFFDADALQCGCIVIEIPEPIGFQMHMRAEEVWLPLIAIHGRDVPTAVLLMKNGAFDYLQRPLDGEVLLASVTRALKAAAIEQEVLAADDLLARLSPRERQVLEGVVQGRTHKQIAFDLGISKRTVEVHSAHMHNRLGVGSLAAAVRIAVLASLGRKDADNNWRRRYN